jgi:PKD repeat protein
MPNTLGQTATAGTTGTAGPISVSGSYYLGIWIQDIDTKRAASDIWLNWMGVTQYDAADTTFFLGAIEDQSPSDVTAYPGYDDPPTDQNGDGLYEDVNGNGRLDFQDIMIFFQYNAWAQANQPNVSCFDWSGNGAIEFSDVQKFWESEFT